MTEIRIDRETVMAFDPVALRRLVIGSKLDGMTVLSYIDERTGEYVYQGRRATQEAKP